MLRTQRLTDLVDDYYKSYDYRNLRDETKKQYEYFINVMLNTEVDGQALSTRLHDNENTCRKGCVQRVVRERYSHG